MSLALAGQTFERPRSAAATLPRGRSGLGVAESQLHAAHRSRPALRQPEAWQKALGGDLTTLLTRDVFLQVPPEPPSSLTKLAGPQTLSELTAMRMPSDPQPDAVLFVVVLRRLVDAERVPAARRLMEAVPIHLANDPGIFALRTVLTPPVVRAVREQGPDRRLEYEWLRTQGPRYRGNWIALDGDHLLAVAATLRELRERVGALAPTRPPLFHRVE